MKKLVIIIAMLAAAYTFVGKEIVSKVNNSQQAYAARIELAIQQAQ